MTMKRWICFATALALCTIGCKAKRSRPGEREKRSKPPRKRVDTMRAKASPSFRVAMDIICHAAKNANVSGLSPIERQQALSHYLFKWVEDEQALAVIKALGAKPPAERGAYLMAAARRAGLKTCPLAQTPLPR